MKTLSKLLEEKMVQSNPDKLDMDWINNDKPVITKSGYEVKIYSVDYKEIPNQLHGKVFFSEGPVDGWVWDERKRRDVLFPACGGFVRESVCLRTLSRVKGDWRVSSGWF